MKIKRIIAAVLSLCMVGGAFTFNSTAVRDYSITAKASAEVKTYGSWSYTENSDGTINIMKCDLHDDIIIVPAALAGKNVYSIGEDAFSECFCEEVSLSEGLKVIDRDAFAECITLKSINIPESVERINSHAFYHTALSSVTLPKNVSYLSQYAFGRCSDLMDITIMNPNCILPTNKYLCVESSGCTFHGFKGSTAEEYAVKWGYKFEALPANKKGDVNGDSVIDGTDATLALKEYASLGQGVSTLTAAQTAGADVDGSGNVDGSDATMILRYYALSGGGKAPDWDHIFD